MSMALPEKDREKFQILLMKAVDGELSGEEEVEFEHFVHTYDSCKEEWQQFKHLKEVTRQMKFKSPPDELWDHYWTHVYNRLERGLAWIFLSIGTIILLIYGAFQAVESLILDNQVATIVKIAVLFVIAGLVILLVSVVREKFMIFRKDPYKEIKR